MHCGYFDTTRNVNHSSFPTLTMVGGRCPLSVKYSPKVTHPSSKNADFDRFPLTTSQPKEMAKKVQVQRIKSRPRALQRAIDGVCSTLPLTPLKGGSKSDFVFFVLNKIQFQSNKVCYKVSLCENFQQQCCSITIPPSNGP